MKILTLLTSQIIFLGSFITNNLIKNNFKILYDFNDIILFTNEIYYCDNYKYFGKINSIAINKDDALNAEN